ncbi:DinB family protein [Paenibacillus qinlingensis]|uniref:Catechol 2,3-dioxygenase-like lactoylglutathione lyase family enzyme n=1 Tax=Paenibacillus qinlingensis TaxID=1837343 RepID=A0ABU1P4U6_9BACL|nr:DinB family protein [Paenibacillus qinlingensis]MDR6554769.1 catechol 2,3-dioxygenase-like lactoylglutathione lyase family enzyme [Paenibacillus qinlingensis]
MYQGRARLLLSVDKLEASLAFYTEQLGWELIELAEAHEAALLHIRGTKDRAVLCAVGASKEQLESILNRWLQPNYTNPQRGSLVYIGVPSVAEVELYLHAYGYQAEMMKHEEPGHIRELHVPTIDGYLLVYWEELFPTDSEIMLMFEAGVVALEKMLEGLSASQLSLREVPGKWSIREHALHLIDLEMVAMHKVKFALAEPGRNYQGNSFHPDEWERGLSYETRPIESEVRLFRAAREHILCLCKHLPDALGRTIQTADRKESVAQILKMMAGHVNHHIRAMKRIRDKHGC